MIEEQKSHRLDELRLYSRSPYRHKGFVREDRSSLRNCPDVAFEFKVAQVIQEAVVHALLFEEGQIVLGKMQILYIVYERIKPGGNDIAAAFRNSSVEHVKIADAVAHSLKEVAVPHAELIKIR